MQSQSYHGFSHTSLIEITEHLLVFLSGSKKRDSNHHQDEMMLKFLPTLFQTFYFSHPKGSL